MSRLFRALSGKRLKRMIWSRFYTFRQINKRYSKPRLKTTRLVRLSLLMLRLYLITLVLILLYKFVSVVFLHHGQVGGL